MSFQLKTLYKKKEVVSVKDCVGWCVVIIIMFAMAPAIRNLDVWKCDRFRNLGRRMVIPTNSDRAGLGVG